MVKLYGSSMSRAGRSLWALEEAGVKFEQVIVAETRKPEYLKINPNGHVPTLDDNGTIIWESMAINLYVAEKYGKAPLWPSTVEGHGACYQWSLWCMTEVETPMIDIFQHRLMLPADQRDEKIALARIETLKTPLKVLDDHLQQVRVSARQGIYYCGPERGVRAEYCAIYSTGSLADSEGAKMDAEVPRAPG